MKLRKAKKFISAAIAAIAIATASTALASVPMGEVVMLPDGNKVCTYPCGDKKNKITLPDGTQVCALHVPQAIEAEVFVIELSKEGVDMVKAIRPEGTPSGQFSVRANSFMTKEQAEKFGKVVNNSKIMLTRDETAFAPFGGELRMEDKVPVVVSGKELDYPIAQYDVGQTIKINVLESLCNSALMSVSVMVSSVESWTEGSRMTRPVVSAKAAMQTQSINFGGGLMIGGMENIGEVDASSDYLIFMNIKEAEKKK